MLWIRFSILLSYSIIFIINVISLIITYDLFITHSSYEFLQDKKIISFYHLNASGAYWFVFSSFISFLLFGLSTIYYICFYTTLFVKFYKTSPEKYFDFFFIDALYMYSIYDFFFISANISWNLIWALHVIIDILIKNASVMEMGELFILLSTQITLISLRYPQIFQNLDSPSSDDYKRGEIAIFETIGNKLTDKSNKPIVDVELSKLIN